jgi:hypothetical protein
MGPWGDGTAPSAGARALAFDLASTEGVPLAVVHNWVRSDDPPGSASYIDSTLSSVSKAVVDRRTARWQSFAAERD